MDYTDFHTNRELNKNRLYFKCRVTSKRSKWFLHSHEGIEIYFFQTGKANYIIGDSVYQLQPGDILVFNGRLLHRVNPAYPDPYVRSYLNFVPSYLAGFMTKELVEKIMTTLEKEDRHLLRLDSRDIEEIESLFKKMDEEQQKEHIGYEALIQSYFTELLILLTRRIKNIDEDSIQPNNTRRELHVHKILNYINNNLKEDLSLDAISEEVFLNKYYLAHCFKEVTGFTINKYISKVRIDKSKNLLINTNESVTNISEMVGLKSPVHLSRLFKQLEGVSPNQYRKGLKNKSALEVRNET